MKRAEKELRESLGILLFNFISKINNHNYKIDIIKESIEDIIKEIKNKPL